MLNVTFFEKILERKHVEYNLCRNKLHPYPALPEFVHASILVCSRPHTPPHNMILLPALVPFSTNQWTNLYWPCTWP